MYISLIAAVGTNNEIGYKNELLCRIKEDFDWFKFHTANKPIVMGRKTYESIGQPLKGRLNIVITSQLDYDPHPDVIVLHSIADVLAKLADEKEIMVIGGEQIYKQFMQYASRLYITELHKEFIADSFFPSYDSNEWAEYFSLDGTENIGFSYKFTVYRRKLQ